MTGVRHSSSTWHSGRARQMLVLRVSAGCLLQGKDRVCFPCSVVSPHSLRDPSSVPGEARTPQEVIHQVRSARACDFTFPASSESCHPHLKAQVTHLSLP